MVIRSGVGGRGADLYFVASRAGGAGAGGYFVPGEVNRAFEIAGRGRKVEDLRGDSDRRGVARGVGLHAETFDFYRIAVCRGRGGVGQRVEGGISRVNNGGLSGDEALCGVLRASGATEQYSAPC